MDIDGFAVRCTHVFRNVLVEIESNIDAECYNTSPPPPVLRHRKRPLSRWGSP